MIFENGAQEKPKHAFQRGGEKNILSRSSIYRCLLVNRKHQSWGEIKDLYLGVKASTPWANDMIALVDHIASSQVAIGLFPWTSMFDLCIAQSFSSYSDSVPFLQISPV